MSPELPWHEASGMTQTLGRLERVEVRDVWSSEASEFTPWLALPENLAILGNTIDYDLEVEAQEKEVGPFRADILCKDLRTGNWVLIENQLERTDHTHLGQLLVYASGLKAVTILWVARTFTEEHRATLDWLNAIAAE
jgi:RecB family endonuclease NucS